MSSIQKDLESRKTTMSCRGDMVTLYATPIAGLWLASELDCARVFADMSAHHMPNVWRFDNGSTFLIESLPSLNVAEIQGNAWVLFMLTEGARHMKPIKIKFREYKKPCVFRT
jgi:hypothetical protein